MAGTEARYTSAEMPGESDQYGALLLPGQGFTSIPSRSSITQAALVASQALNLTFFRAPKTFSSTSVRMFTGSTAAAATPTLVRHGLWTVDITTGALLALAASTPNDTALFATPGTNTAFSKSWSSPMPFIKGQWYAHGVLIVSAVALPTLFGVAATNGFIPSAVLPRVSGSILSQADLPSSAAGGAYSAATGAGRLYAEFN